MRSDKDTQKLLTYVVGRMHELKQSSEPDSKSKHLVFGGIQLGLEWALGHEKLDENGEHGEQPASEKPQKPAF